MSEHNDKAPKDYAAIAVYYRNLAIKLGAKPEQMVDEVDYSLCQYQIDTCDIPPSVTKSITEELKAAKEKADEMCCVAAKLTSDLSDAIDCRDKLLNASKMYISWVPSECCTSIRCSEKSIPPTCTCLEEKNKIREHLTCVTNKLWSEVWGTEPEVEEELKTYMTNYVYQ